MANNSKMLGYMKNTAKSLKFFAVDEIKKQNPALKDFAEVNSDIFKSTYQAVVTKSAENKRISDVIKGSKYYDNVSTFKKNLLSDIKTGNLYNNKRAQEEEDNFLKGFGMDMDMSFDDIDVSNVNNSEAPVNMDIRDSAKAISIATEQTGEMMMENDNANASLAYSQRAKNTNALLKGMNANARILAELTPLVGINKTMAQNQKIFYETMTSGLNEGMKSLKNIENIMVAMQKASEPQKSSSGKKVSFEDVLTSSGALNLSEYKKIIKKNIANIGMMGRGMDMMGADPLQMIANQPLYYLLEFSGLKSKMIPAQLRKRMKELNGSMNGAGASYIHKMNNLKNSDNIILRALGEALGIDNSMKSKIDTSKYNKGRAPFTGMDHKALTEVIPEYLSKLVEAQTGESWTYNYDMGKFVRRAGLKKDFQSIKDSYYETATFDIRKEMKKNMEALTFDSKYDKKELEKSITNVLKKVFNEGKLFNPNSKGDESWEYGLDTKTFKIIQSLFGNAKKSTQLKFNRDVMNGRDSLNKELERMADNGSPYISLFNGISDMKFDSKKMSKSSFLNTIVDNKGNNIFYYLQNIYSELYRMNGTASPAFAGGYIGTNGLGINRRGPINMNNNPEKPKDYEFEREMQREENYSKYEADRMKKKYYLRNPSNYNSHNIRTAVDSGIEGMHIMEDPKDKSFMHKLYRDVMNSTKLSDASKKVAEDTKILANKPIEFMDRVLEKTNDHLYRAIYGYKSTDGKSIKGIAETMAYEFRDRFESMKDWFGDNLIAPIATSLGLSRKAKMVDIIKKLADKTGLTAVGKNFKDKIWNSKFAGSMKDSMKSNFGGLWGSIKTAVGSVTPKSKNRYSYLDALNPNTLPRDNKQAMYNDVFGNMDLSGLSKGAKEKYIKAQLKTYNIQKSKNSRLIQKAESELATLDSNSQEYMLKSELVRKLKMSMQFNNSILDKENMKNLTIMNRMSRIQNRKSFSEEKKKQDKANNILALNNVIDKMVDSDPSKMFLINYRNNLMGKSDVSISSLEKELKSLAEERKQVESEINKLVGIYLHPTKFSKGYNQKTKEQLMQYQNRLSQIELKQFNLSANKKDLENKDLANKGIFTTNSLKNANSHYKNSIAQKIAGKEGEANIPGFKADESAAATSFANDLAGVINNYIHSEIPFYAKGGNINQSTMAVVGKGEVVVPAEDVERMKKIFSNVGSNMTSGKKMSDTAKGAYSKFSGMMRGLTPEQRKAYLNKYADLSQDMDFGDMDEIQRAKTVRINKSIYEDLNNNVNDRKYGQFKEWFSSMGKSLDEARTALFGESEQKEKKGFAVVLNDVINNVQGYAPDAISKGIIGGGISLVTGALGGPLMGAAAGVGISLIKNSDKMQDWLFGEKDSKGERVGGKLLSGKFQKNIKKYIPDVKNLGIVGGLAGLTPLAPFGPITGLMLGGTVGYLKNSKKFQDRLFGEENGIFDKKKLDAFQKKLPSMGMGAAASMMFSPLPFGLLGNAVIGSGLGYVTTTERFKEALFGKKDKNGKYQGGMLSTVRNVVVDPLKNNLDKIRDEVIGFIKKDCLGPLKSAMVPFSKQIEVIGKSIQHQATKRFSWLFNKILETPLNRLKNRVTKPLETILGKTGRFGINVGKKVISSPFKAVGLAGEGLKRRQIKKGNATYMSARERLDYREDHANFGMAGGDRYSGIDNIIAQMSDNNPDQINELVNNIDFVTSNSRKLDNESRTMRTKLYSANFLDKLSRNDVRKYKKMVEKGDIEGIKQFMADKNVNLENSDEYMSTLGRYSLFRKDRSNKEAMRNDMVSKLQKAGFGSSIKGKEILKGDYTSLAHLSELLKAESGFNKKPSSAPETIEQKTEGYQNSVVDNMQNILDELSKLRNDYRLYAGVSNPDGDKFKRKNGIRYKKDKDGNWVEDASDPITKQIRKNEVEADKLKAKRLADDIARENGERDSKGMLYVKDSEGNWQPDMKDEKTARIVKIKKHGYKVFAKEKLFGDKKSTRDANGNKITNNGIIGNAGQKILQGYNSVGTDFNSFKNKRSIEKAQIAKEDGFFNRLKATFFGKKKEEKKGKGILGKLLGIGGFAIGGLKSLMSKFGVGSAVSKFLPFLGKMGPLGSILGGTLLLTKAPAIISGFKTTVAPWIEDKALPWIKENLFPEIGKGFKALTSALPDIIIGGSKFLIKNFIPFTWDLGKTIVSGIFEGVKSLLPWYKGEKSQDVEFGSDESDNGSELRAIGENATKAVDTGKYTSKANTSFGYKKNSKHLSFRSGNDTTGEEVKKSTEKSIARNILTGGATGNAAKVGENIAKGATKGGQFANGMLHPFNTLGRGLSKGAESLGDKFGFDGSKVGKAFGYAQDAKNAIFHPIKTFEKVKDGGKVFEGVYKAAEDGKLAKGMKKIGKFGGLLGKGVQKAGDFVGNSKLGKLNKVAGDMVMDKGAAIVETCKGSIKKFFEKILSSAVIQKLIGSDKVKKLSEKLMGSFLEKIGKQLLKCSGKLTGRVVAALGSGGLLNIVWAAADFISGYNNAENILGIDQEPTFGMKICCGLLKAFNGLFLVLSFIPEKTWVNLIMDDILPIFGKDDTELQKMRQQARENLDKYNQQTGQDLSLEEYNKKQKEENGSGDGFFAKVGKGAGSVMKKIGNGLGSLWEGTKSVASSAWEGTKSLASSAWNGVKSFFGAGGGKGSIGGYTGIGGGNVKGIPMGTSDLAGIYNQYDAAFKSAGAKYGIDPEWMKAVSMQESGGDPNSYNGAALGLMQIENGGTTDEFINYGREQGESWTAADRADPNKAIPFAAYRLVNDLKRYNNDYLKATQAYNFSHYSLDMLLKQYPNGDDWIAHRGEMGSINGCGSPYGDSKYIEHVLRYYHGNAISPDGTGTGAISEGTADGSSGAPAAEAKPKFSDIFSSLGEAFSGAVGRFYGFKEDEAQAGTPATGGTGAVGTNATGNRATAIQAAQSLLGSPYVWGGNTLPTKDASGNWSGGFDCSSFVQYACKQAGVEIPRTTYEQVNCGSPVSGIENAKPGDLLFFHNTGHVGMYLGDNKYIHDPHTGDVVKVSDIGNSVYNNPEAIRDVFGAGGAGGYFSRFVPGKGMSMGGPIGQYFANKLNGTITSGFGKRDVGSHTNIPTNHTGIDIGARRGTNINSPIGGVVSRNIPAAKSNGFGNVVGVKDGRGVEHLFGHMSSKSDLSVGTPVKAGTTVGKVGSTGNSTGPHLHYETQIGGRPVNPEVANAIGGPNDNAKAQALAVTKAYTEKQKEAPLNSSRAMGGPNDANDKLDKCIELLQTIAANTLNLNTIVQLISNIVQLVGGKQLNAAQKADTTSQIGKTIKSQLQNRASMQDNSIGTDLQNLMSVLTTYAQS